MKKIEKTFTSKNFSHKQIHREGDFAIYERCHDITPDKKHYEVIKIQSHNGYAIGGQMYPASEFYPSSNAWGADGYTCLDKESAYKKLDKMMQDHKIREEEKKKKEKKK
jgi:hypothetical protein